MQYVYSGRSTTHEGPWKKYGPQATGETDYRPAPHNKRKLVRRDVEFLFSVRRLAPAVEFLRYTLTRDGRVNCGPSERGRSKFFRVAWLPSLLLFFSMAVDDISYQDRKSKT